MCPAPTILLSGLANPSSWRRTQPKYCTWEHWVSNPTFVAYCLCDLGHGTVTLLSLSLLMCKMG